jgi:hypothetical protein
MAPRGHAPDAPSNQAAAYADKRDCRQRRALVLPLALAVAGALGLRWELPDGAALCCVSVARCGRKRVPAGVWYVGASAFTWPPGRSER